LYDSGSTCHISPYRDQFITYQEIPSQSLNTANNQKFAAIGKGDLVVEIPNGVNTSKLTLTEVLYSPHVGYTLVSIGKFDKSGFTTKFGNSKCTIQDCDGEVIGEISWSEKGIYRVMHDSDEVNAVIETMSYVDLHRCIGHISPGVAHKLAENGLVSGIRIKDLLNGNGVFCKSCVYAKAMRKPIAKECQGECALKFGDEIHTDL
jgi:hypothetical protein